MPRSLYNCRSSCDRVSMRKRLFGFRRQRQNETQTLSETLAGLGREPFEVIAGKCPDTPHVRKMSLNLQRPAFQGGFAFPE